MSKNNSPGHDVEFYCHFYDDLKFLFHNVVTSIWNDKELSRSMKLGIINLVYKKRGDKSLVNILIPISLLYVDSKILARVMSNRQKSTNFHYI